MTLELQERVFTGMKLLVFIFDGQRVVASSIKNRRKFRKILGWIGVGFLAASFMFMAVSQLKFSSQKKVLQYHSLAVLAQGYMSGRDTAAGLLDADVPGPYWAFAAVLFLISIVPCYVGVTDKDKVE